MLNATKALFILDDNFTTEAVAFKKALAFAHDNQAVLDFICVLPDLAPLHYSNSTETIMHITRTIVDSTTERYYQTLSTFDKQLKYSLKVVVGKVYLEIINEVLKKQYDLVIKQSENPSWLHSVFGSNDLHLLRKCPCSVWLIHEQAKHPYANVVAAIDFSDDDVETDLNSRIAHQAAAFSLHNKAQMHVVSAYDASVVGFASLWANNPNKFEKDFLEEEKRRRGFSARYLIDQMKQESNNPLVQALTVKQHIIEGHPVSTIPAKVNELDADLVVMGTVGRSGMMGMLIGNTAESVLLQLTCSVLALKPSDFVCPISLRH
jgi:nucleotide-binding universal stress UspA family protein